MTTRDPRSRVLPPEGRDPTQSLSLESGSADSHPSLAVGTSGDAREERTKVESPSGRNHLPRPASRPPPTPRHPDDPEQRIDSVIGSYRLIELLGKGGMGYVYRAEHVKLGREVALKLLRADYARRRDAVLRFFQEAKTVNRVRHRNIVDVTDFVELDDGTTFIIMELLQGQSLGKWARSGVDLPRALAVLVQICDGLGAAHAVGVIHRDLKPDNVIVVPTSDGAELVKLLDFGVAKLLNRDDEDIGFQTAAGSVIGTPAYMSPEQAGGMAIDHRSDIYSLGAIMYELLAGQPMFRGRSFGEYVRKHLTELPPPVHQTQGGANVDPRLEALVMKCLAKAPEERFGHILELRDGLLHILGGGLETVVSGIVPLPHSGSLVPVTLAPLPTPQAPMSTHLSSVRPAYTQYTAMPEHEPAAPWWLWMVGGAFAVALGIGGAVWYVRHGEAPPAAPEAARPAAAPVAVPTAAPIEAPPVHPQMIELRFDSLPNAGVYAEGHSAELCRTPCAFNINLADGEPTDHRHFVVRAEGYKDKTVDVDLAGSQRDFNVTLDQLDAAATAAEPDDTAAPPPPHRRRAGQRHGDRKLPHDDKTARPEDDATLGDPADRDASPDKTATPPAPTPTPPPADKPTPPAPGQIDPSDTLDPFRHSP